MIDWIQNHAITFVSGGLGIAIVGHAVNTFPTPTNKYGGWLLGVIQYAVGQRVAAGYTFQGLQTEARGITTAQKEQDLRK